jgi:hypothetical protein
MTVLFSQSAPFSGPAYQYLRADDALPSHREIADQADPLCRVKLFQPGSRWTYYVCAATERRHRRAGADRLLRLPARAHCDEFGSLALAEIAALRVRGLPPERDLHFAPAWLSVVEAHVARHGHGP